MSSNLQRDSHFLMYIVHMRFNVNLRPGKRSLVAKIKDEAGVHYVMTLDPRDGFSYKLQFFSVR